MVTRTPLSRVLRRRERGTAVLVVLLVIMMLTGIGVFATRAASLGTLSSGFDRQMTQTHYVTEYAIMATTAELSTNRRDAYVKAMKSNTQKLQCPSIVDTTQTPPVVIPNATCYQFGYADLQKQMAAGGTNTLVMPYSPGPPLVGGGLGFVPLEADFLADMTDLGPATPPVAGNDLTSAGAVAVNYMAVTLNVTGQVRPLATTTGTLDTTVAQSASIETWRAHLVVGPLSKP